VDDPLDTWFRREILAHEAILVRYLRRAWSQAQDDIDDLRQETYVQVYEAARTARPHSPRAFLLTTARNLIVNRYRRTRVVSIEPVGDFDDLNISTDELTPERRLDARQQLRRLTEVLNELPPKCRQVIWMRRIDGLTQKEVADHLGISVRTVESHILKGMRWLAAAYLGQYPTLKSIERQSPTEIENEHGQRPTD
jgi:RNA polymerase sigma factor (sigma-70 family)